MKTKHLSALLQPNLTTVKVVFSNSDAVPVPPTLKQEASFDIFGNVEVSHQPWAASPPPPVQHRPSAKAQPVKGYVYKVLKDDGYKVGDIAVALTERGMVLVTVVEVHETPELDLDADFDYKWLVQRVDTTRLAEQQQAEKNFQIAILEIERRKQRDRLKQELMSFYGDTPEGLELLNASIAQLEGRKNDN